MEAGGVTTLKALRLKMLLMKGFHSWGLMRTGLRRVYRSHCNTKWLYVSLKAWEKHKIYHKTWVQYFISELFISTMWVKFLITELLKGWITVALSSYVHAAYAWGNWRGNIKIFLFLFWKQHISISSQNIRFFFFQFLFLLTFCISTIHCILNC